MRSLLIAVYIFALVFEVADGFQRRVFPRAYGTHLRLASRDGDEVLRQQAKFGLREKQSPVTVLEIAGVLGRFRERLDFFEGVGYSRRSIGDRQLLTNARLFERLKDKAFLPDAWPIDKRTGALLGLDPSREGADKEEVLQRLQNEALSPGACYAVFTSLAKGAGNGCAWPVQVDEELGKWLCEDEADESKRIFDVEAFESTLAMGKLQVAVGWFLFVGLQGFAIYHLFLRAAVKQFAPDFYDVLY